MKHSNAGYVVLGGLVERVTGEDYYEYVRKHIYGPAGMERSGHFFSDSLSGNTAFGYTRGDGEAADGNALVRNVAMLPGRGSAAGGGYSTAGDLEKFLAALRAGTLEGGPPAGLGVAGGAPGINAVVEGDLPGGYDLIVLSNLYPPAAEQIAVLVRNWLGADD